jgi:hypothetical protein
MRLRSKAECLGDEDDVDTAGRFVVDDQSLREQERRRDRSDRRRAIIELSAQAEHVLAELDRALRQIDDEILATLTGSQRETLNALLAQAVEHIPAHCTRLADEGC